MYHLDIPPHVANEIRILPPDIKKNVKEALRGLAENPQLGEPLLRELKGLWKYRVRRYRIVYQPDRSHKRLQIYAVEHRKSVYDLIRVNKQK